MKPKTLHDLFVDELRDLLSAEKQLVKALPKMAKAATAPELRAGIEEHLAQTEGQVARLEEAFELLGLTAKAKKCAAMEGLLEEGKELMEEEMEPAVKDAALICAAQKVEHYEIASYGCVRTWAGLLGLPKVGALLSATLEEEKAADEKLTRLAEGRVNADAQSGDDSAAANGKHAKKGASAKK